jgi:hypothetical protein
VFAWWALAAVQIGNIVRSAMYFSLIIDGFDTRQSTNGSHEWFDFIRQNRAA